MAATDDTEVNERVSELAEQQRIFCVRADDADAATAFTPAVGQPRRRHRRRDGQLGRRPEPASLAPACATTSWRPCARARSARAHHRDTRGPASCWSAAARATPS